MKIQSKTQELTELLAQNIRNGIYPDGAELPSEGVLAQEFKMSRSTVRIALSSLSKQGAIVKARGKRSVVCASALNKSKHQLRFVWLSFDAFLETPTYLSMFSELQKQLLELNASLTFLPIPNPQQEAWAAGIIGSYDGVFLAGIRQGIVIPELEKVLSSMTNVVELNNITFSIGRYLVSMDDYAAGRMAADYLLDHGCKTVAFVDRNCAVFRGYHNRICGLMDGYRARSQNLPMYSCGDTVGCPPDLKRILSENPDMDTVWHVCDSGALEIRYLLERDFPQKGKVYHSAGVDGIQTMISDIKRYLQIPSPVRDGSQLSYYPPPSWFSSKLFDEGVKNHLSLAIPVQGIIKKGIEVMLELVSGKTPDSKEYYLKPVLIPWLE